MRAIKGSIVKTHLASALIVATGIFAILISTYIGFSHQGRLVDGGSALGVTLGIFLIQLGARSFETRFAALELRLIDLAERLERVERRLGLTEKAFGKAGA